MTRSDIIIYSEGHLGTTIVALDHNLVVIESRQIQVGSMDRWSVHVAELVGISYATSSVLKLAHQYQRTTNTETILINNPLNSTRRLVLPALLPQHPFGLEVHSMNWFHGTDHSTCQGLDCWSHCILVNAIKSFTIWIHKHGPIRESLILFPYVEIVAGHLSDGNDIPYLYKYVGDLRLSWFLKYVALFQQLFRIPSRLG